MSEKPKDDEERLEWLKELFSNCEKYYSELYQDGKEDQDFLYGLNQWDDSLRDKRVSENRPALVLNQMLPFAHQVINDIKQARPAIKVSPVDNEGDEDTAEIFQGIIRNIEQRSAASDTYDMAAMNSVASGYGWIRIGTKYVDSMSFDQEPIIERVPNFQSVMLDYNHVKLDGSDASFCFIFEDVDKDAFKEEYPDKDAVDFEGNKNAWSNEDTVRVAECFYKDITFKKIYLIRDENEELVVDEKQKKELEDAGVFFEVTDERETEITTIKYYKFTGSDILEQSDWIGDYLPIVPVYGEECWVDGKRRSYSLIHQAKDAQRMYNYHKSASTEVIALQPRAPMIGAVGSFDSYPEKWANANNVNYPFLEYDVVYDEQGARVEPPQRQMPPQGSPVMQQEAIGAREDIRLGLGIFESGLGQQGSDVSGTAIKHRQIKGENSTFHFMDNLASSIAQVGVILVDLIPKLYNKQQVVRIIGMDGNSQSVPINQPFTKDEKGLRPLQQGEQPMGIYKLDAGKYDVVCDVGASYASKRQEMSDKLIEITKAAPELMTIVGDKIMDTLDLPEGKEIADRLRSQMSPELLGEDPQAAKLQAAAKALEQMQEKVKNYEAALADKERNQKFDNALDAEKAQLERDKFQLDAEKTKADIAKIYADIQMSANQEDSKIDEITARIDDVSTAMEILLDNIEQNTETPEPLIEGEDKLMESEKL